MQTVDTPAAKPIPLAIGSYEVSRVIGQGGMGTVYLARHRLLRRKAAVKVLHPELSRDPEAVARFFNEARAISMIRHPGIVEIFDCDRTEDDSAYIAMELLQGEDLHSYLKRKGRLPLALALAMARQIADALEAAHVRGVIHRDLKPDNVFVLAPTSGEQVPQLKVLDFGIAKLVTREEDPAITKAGRLMGTPLYMAPEACRGGAPVDMRADIYALGCVLFEMATGRPPFPLTGEGEILAAHIYAPAPTASSIEPSLPPQLDALLERLLDKDPDQRPDTMAAVNKLLDSVPIGPVPAFTPLHGTFLCIPRPTPAWLPQRTVGSARSWRWSVMIPAALAGMVAAWLAAPAVARSWPTLDQAARALVEPPWSGLFAEVVATAAVAAPAEATEPALVPEPILGAVSAPAPEAVAVGATRTGPSPDPPRSPDAPTPTPIDDWGPPQATQADVAPVSAARTPGSPTRRKVRLALVSQPVGAEVWIANAGVLLGVTPCSVVLEATQGDREIAFSLAGYKTKTRRVPSDVDAQIDVELTRARRPPSRRERPAPQFELLGD